MAAASTLEYVESWLGSHAAASLSWLQGACAATAVPNERAFFLAFAMAPRKVPRTDLPLPPDQRRELEQRFPGWRPWRWSLDQLARTRLLLALPSHDPAQYIATLDRLFAAAGLHELVALYQALPLLPHGPLLVKRAAEGIRSSMGAVFEAVALDNAYPQRHLDQDAWNQMLLKCLFVGSDLRRVVGMQERGNPLLMRMLCGYAHERWAAKRAVDPLLWKAVGRHADAAALSDLERVLSQGDERERAAAVLALSEQGSAEALRLIARYPTLSAALGRGELSWSRITP